jgi:hypothetical protein
LHCCQGRLEGLRRKGVLIHSWCRNDSGTQGPRLTEIGHQWPVGVIEEDVGRLNV